MIRRATLPAGAALPLRPADGRRLLPWIVTLLTYIAGLAAVGLLVVDDTLSAATASLNAGMTLQVPASASPPRLTTALALLRQTPGIASARLLTPAETGRLLEPWLGSAGKLDDLPVPRLIDILVAPKGVVDQAQLRQQLASVVPDAQLDDHRAWLDAMRRAADRVDAVLSAAIAAALLVMAAVAAVAARIDLGLRQTDIELLQLLGARDRDIANRIAAGLWRGALIGGAAGAVAVLLTIVALDRAAALVQLPTPLVAPGIADWRPWLVAAATALAAALIAVASARLATMRHLTGRP